MNNSIQFTDVELETISAAMDDYIHYEDDNTDPNDLIGGLSVEDRVSSIKEKIYQFFLSNGGN